MFQMQQTRSQIFKMQNQEMESSIFFLKAIFGWDYSTWCRCYLCGEQGHTGENCIRTHMRKRDPTKRSFVCKELGHLAKNCMNQATM